MKKETKLNTALKLIAKSSLIVFIGVTLSKILTYFYRILIARYFGPEVYGLFSLVLMILGWFVAISALGLSDGLLRYIPLYRAKNQKKKIKHIFKISSTILIFTTITSAIILFLLSDFISINIFHNAELIIFLKYFSLAIPLFVFSYLFLAVIRAFERISTYSFIVNIFQNLIKFLGLAFLILIGFKINAIIFSFLIGLLLMFIASYLYCKYKLPQIFGKSYLDKKEKSKITKQLLSYSWPIMFVGVFVNIFYWIDSFSIGYFKTATEVGFYNAAVPISAILMITSELFIQLFFPMITKEYAKNKLPLIRDLSKQIGKWIFIINIPLVLLLIFFPGVLINLLFGAQYLVAETALRFLAIAALFASIFVISSNLVTMIGKSKLILVNILVASFINILLNIWLVPMQKILFIENSLGITGAAIATMISVIIFNLLFFFQAKYYISITPLRKKMFCILLIALFLTIILFFATSFIQTTLLNSVLIGIGFLILYFFLIFRADCLDKTDLMILNTIKEKIFK